MTYPLLMNASDAHHRERFKRSVFYQMVGRWPDDLDQDDLLRAELAEYGLDGVYQGVVMCAECLCHPDTDRRFHPYFLADLSTAGQAVLEFGAGVGDKADTLLSTARPSHLTLVDTGFMYAFLRELYHAAPDVTVLPALRWVEDASIDIAYSYDVLEHVKDPAFYLAELRRVLKPDGRLAVVAPFEDAPDSYPLHRPEHRALSLRDLVFALGFTLVEERDIHDPYHITKGVLLRK
jgi:SAM-dependent methyltransferase